MTFTKTFGGIKSTKGFTLVEIIVVLIILAILAAATIPSMLGFVKEAKQKSLTSEVRAVYTAAQAYVTEHYAIGDLDAEAINGEINSDHPLYYLLQNDATGTISGMNIEGGKVTSFAYIKNNVQANYSLISGITFTTLGSSVAPSSSTLASAEPSVVVSPSVEPLPSPSLIVKSTTFDVGQVVNKKMKILAGNLSANYNSSNSNIVSILRATYEQFSASGVSEDEDDSSNHVLSVGGANPKIYAWYADNSIYYYTKANKVFLNADSSYLFYVCRGLTDISVLQYWDTSNVTNLEGIFCFCGSLSDISVLSNWDVSGVTRLGLAFRDNSVSDISALSDWDISNVTSLAFIFQNCTLLSDISFLSSWNTSNVTDFGGVFCGCTSLGDISILSNWDTSKLTSLYITFSGCSSLTDATVLDGWNVDISEVDSRDTFKDTQAETNRKLPSWYN